MRTWQVLLVAALAATGCKKKLHWQDKRAPSVAMAGFTVTVPAGWRDGAEAHDEELDKLLAGQPGAHVFVREDFDGTSILVKSGEGDAVACDMLANTVAKNEGAVSTDIKSSTTGGDPTCAWTYSKDEMVGRYFMRFHGGKLIAVMCFPGKDTAAQAACTTTVDSLALK